MITDFTHKFVAGPSPVTLLLLHGTGGDENDLLPVARAVAPGAGLLSPRGRAIGQGMVRFFGLDWKDVPERAAELAAWVGAAALVTGIVMFFAGPTPGIYDVSA